MNIVLTPQATEQIQLLQQAGSRGYGVILGSILGKYLIIETALLTETSRQRFHQSLPDFFRSCGPKLQGVLFCRRPPEFSSAIAREAILQVSAKEVSLYAPKVLDFRTKSLLTKWKKLRREKDGVFR